MIKKEIKPRIEIGELKKLEVRAKLARGCSSGELKRDGQWWSIVCPIMNKRVLLIKKVMTSIWKNICLIYHDKKMVIAGWLMMKIHRWWKRALFKKILILKRFMRLRTSGLLSRKFLLFLRNCYTYAIMQFKVKKIMTYQRKVATEKFCGTNWPPKERWYRFKWN